MNTQENNKMIAEFMGDYNFEHTEGGLPIGDFSNSWDWLMPVVEKINNILDDDDEFVYSVNIHPNMVTIYCENYDHIFVSNEHGGTMKEMLYLAVVKFINQHNESTD